MSSKIQIPANTAPAAIVLGTNSTNPEFNAKSDYAVVRLTPGLVDQVRRRVELAREAGRRDDDLYELNFWGGTAEFYDTGILEACQAAMTADQAAQDGMRSGDHPAMPPVHQPAIRNRLDCEPEALGRIRDHERPAAGGSGGLRPQRPRQDRVLNPDEPARRNR
jgi:hypothetical protein